MKPGLVLKFYVRIHVLYDWQVMCDMSLTHPCMMYVVYWASSKAFIPLTRCSKVGNKPSLEKLESVCVKDWDDLLTEPIDFVFEHHASLFQHVVPPSFRFRHFCGRSYASRWMWCGEVSSTTRGNHTRNKTRIQREFASPKKAENINDFAHLKMGDNNGLKSGYLASMRRWNMFEWMD